MALVDNTTWYKTPEQADIIFGLFVEYVSEWKTRIPALRSWSFNFHQSREKMLNGHSSETGAHVEYFPSYEDATVTVFLPDGVEWNEADIEETSVHELMHCLLSTLLEACIAYITVTPENEKILSLLEEQTCTRLASGFMKTKYPEYEAGVKA